MQAGVPAWTRPDGPEVSVRTKTLAETLNAETLTAHYMDAYSNAIHNLGNSRWNTIEDDTNFGKLLHKEGLWSLYQYREEKSLLYHMCRNEYGRMELVNSNCDSMTSRCTMCDKTAPDEIKGIWTLHNFDWVQENGGRDV